MLLYYSTTAAARFGDNPQSPENKQASMQISQPRFRQIVIIVRSSKQQQQHRSGGESWCRLREKGRTKYFSPFPLSLSSGSLN
jgi:hypothetical protein